MMISGSVSGIEIPPQMDQFYEKGECPKEYTEKLPFPITILATGLHMHKAGKSVWTEIRRGDELVAWWGYTNNEYDFQAQSLRAFVGQNPVLMPGDQIETYCVYNTMDRNKTTRGGFATMDEMCLTILSYYPKLDGAFCTTKAKPLNINSTINIKKPDPSTTPGFMKFAPLGEGNHKK